MDKHKQSWENYYRNTSELSVDPWLEDYADSFFPEMAVLDLGCGNGANIPFLLSRTPHVRAFDYARSAVESLSRKYKIETVVADMRDPLPYGDQGFDVVVCDLSLHYFSELDTKSILLEIHRILKEGGTLLARVNSSNDVKHGAKKGLEIERLYFDHEGKKKRFFDERMVLEFFSHPFQVVFSEEKRTRKYAEEKILWEIKANKTSATRQPSSEAKTAPNPPVLKTLSKAKAASNLGDGDRTPG